MLKCFIHCHLSHCFIFFFIQSFLIFLSSFVQPILIMCRDSYIIFQFESDCFTLPHTTSALNGITNCEKRNAISKYNYDNFDVEIFYFFYFFFYLT